MRALPCKQFFHFKYVLAAFSFLTPFSSPALALCVTEGTAMGCAISGQETVSVTSNALTELSIHVLSTQPLTSGSIARFVPLRRDSANGRNSSGIAGSGSSAGGAPTNPDITLNIAGGTLTSAVNAVSVIQATSVGGNGGNGGTAKGISASAGHGGAGAAGSNVTITVRATRVTTSGENAHGILAESIGGNGGNGGSASGLYAKAGRGGSAAGGGNVVVNSNAVLETHGAGSTGIYAQSVGGTGGRGGSASALIGGSGSGSPAAPGGTIRVNNEGRITTYGERGHAIFAQSVGGFGGAGGSGGGLFSFGGNGGSAGEGGRVFVVESGTLTTFGRDARGIFAQSIGGGGGAAGSASGVLTLGGSGNVGGNGGIVTIETRSQSTITTSGANAQAIFVQSIGGGGGSGGSASGLSAIGGRSGVASHGGTVTVNNAARIHTSGSEASGILAQSVGGGGGAGGRSAGLGAVGGEAGGGGHGGSVAVVSSNTIETQGLEASGILAQSIGGGGGSGGRAVSAGIIGSMSVGGRGGSGGNGGVVSVTTLNSAQKIHTAGLNAHGIFAQSVGGGGGDGGASYAGSVGPLSINTSIGGVAGGGGQGNAVTINNLQRVITEMSGSVGIFAQSIGGGGGEGGFSSSSSIGVLSFATALGGRGGAGGNSGAITLTNNGTIETRGMQAYGILAQSVGGGGGKGGSAIASNLSFSAGGLPAASSTVAIGGSGGDGGRGSTVTVRNTASVSTGRQSTGDGSHALLLQSIGGGGGAGGMAGAFAIQYGNGVGISIGIGGTGGRGGDGGIVSLSNSGKLETWGRGASGVFAQSVGGGGGDGGHAATLVAAAGDTNVNAAISVGGRGGNGGKGSAVTLHNTGDIFTYGSNSYGLFAQSVGGGGGNGGASLSATINWTANNRSVGVAVGGRGGNGNTADTVKIDNYGLLLTEGDASTAVLAQSIGGGGGNGGLALVGSATRAPNSSAQFGVAVGGNGGSGNNGGLVHVTMHQGSGIYTSGYEAHGIQAQSIGGGGGNGGMAQYMGQGLPNSGSSMHVGVTVGGSGGAGGRGGEVKVTNDAAITVLAENAMGIYAQSIGGGGGDGGGSFSSVNSRFNTEANDTRALNVSVAVGGSGGNGNHGGAVSVTNSGTIRTGAVLDDVRLGTNGHAIMAQSIGGGGGNGGRANAYNMLKDTTCIGMMAPIVCEPSPNKANNLTITASVGGRGGGASDGGAVHAVNTGKLETFGNNASGIFAQSIGGGGGNGGNGTQDNMLYDRLPSDIGTALSFYNDLKDVSELRNPSNVVDNLTRNLSVSVGGSQGSSGHGGSVNVSQNGNILTHGGTSHAIFAQSIGGGGGTAGNASGGLFTQLTIGGKGGAAGNGGNVRVETGLASKTITEGAGALGIFAQSIGGGGGVGGNAERAFGNPYIGLGLGLVLGGGRGGHGGAVDVIANGLISTSGIGAAGIFAQSVGGGGGVAGNGAHNFVGSAGDAGNGGNVTVAVKGIVTTTGGNATGVYAQSAGGGRSAGGVVNVAVTGSVAAKGEGSVGVIAQSTGLGGQKAVNVSVQKNASISGGKTASGEADREKGGIGVRLINGTDNTLINHGLITTEGGVQEGYAIIATGGLGSKGVNTALDNYGHITGSIFLGQDARASAVLSNRTDGWLNTGKILNIETGRLINEGTLAPGGKGVVQTTVITAGNFTQTSSGIYRVDLDFSTPVATADKLVFNGNGTIVLGGNVQVDPRNLTFEFLGASSGVLIAESSQNRLTYNNLNVIDSSAVDYSLIRNTNELWLNYSVNFAPQGLTQQSGFLANGIAPLVGNAPNSPDGWNSLSPDIQNIITSFLGIGTVEEFNQALLQFTPNAFEEQNDLLIDSGMALGKAMMSCRTANGAAHFTAEGECAWMSADIGRVERNADSTTLGYAQNNFMLSAGAQNALSEHLRLGFGLSWEDHRTATRSGSSADGDRFNVGSTLKYVQGNSVAALSVVGGAAFSTVDRAILLPGIPAYTLSSDQKVGYISGQMRLSHTFDFGQWYVKPAIAFGVSYLRQSGFTERGGALALSLDATDTSYFTYNPSLEVGGDITANDLLMRPFLRVGLIDTQALGKDTVNARLAGLPGSVPFQLDAVKDPILVELAAGVDIFASDKLVVRVTGEGAMGKNYKSYGANIKLSMPFSSSGR